MNPLDAHAETTLRPVGRHHTGGGPSQGGSSPTPRQHHRSIPRFAGAALVVIVAAGAITRFVTAYTDEPSAAATPVQVLTDAQKLSALEQKAQSNPTEPRLWQDLGAAYVQRLVQTSDATYVGLATRSLDQAEALRPNDVTTAVIRGVLELNLHQFAQARTLGEAAAVRSPQNADLLGVLVDANVETGRYDEAGARLQQMLDRRPGLAALTRVSYLRELNGDVEGALSALRQATSAGTGASAYDLATVSALRGDLLFNHGRVDEAADAYTDALSRSPGHLLATLGQARVLTARGDRDGAIALLQARNNALPSPTGAALLGDIATLDGRADVATNAYALVRAMDALQVSAGANVDLESALFEADHGGAPAKVLDLATKAYAARPSIHGADALAWARYRTGDIAGARTAIDEARRLGTVDASLLFHAAAIHAAAGDTASARTELTQALAANPWFALANRTEVAALATRLGVALPPEWTR
jgi:tetratricopeptide (TPR) repeat protein